MTTSATPARTLVTGATGYIGGRLIPRLLEAGHRVRVLVRDPRRVAQRSWAGRVEIAVGDLLSRETLPQALAGVDAAFYLVHSMSAGHDFAAQDRLAAGNFADAARHRLSHVVYLGGLLPPTSDVSDHLASRAEVGEILRSALPATELRAGPIIGSGSASFEMVRYLTERLPVMVAPRWILNEVQPIAVDDVLSIMLLSLDRGPAGVVDIGSEVLTFKQMMETYAAVRGLRRLIVPVPVLAPRLAALWVGLVTPIPNRLAVPLIEGVSHPVVGDTARARELFPAVQPMTYRRAVESAVADTARGAVETRWSGALADGPTYELSDWEGMFSEVRTVHVDAPPERVFRSFARLGGDRGWLVWGWAWRLRGLLDRLVGGPGLRRGRRHPEELLPGEAVDFWRVEHAVAPGLLRLRAEMRLPGRAWMQWEAVPESGGTRLVQTALFVPRGFAGTLYWNALYPIHRLIFSDLVRAVAREAERGDGRMSSTTTA